MSTPGPDATTRAPRSVSFSLSRGRSERRLRVVLGGTMHLDGCSQHEAVAPYVTAPRFLLGLDRRRRLDAVVFPRSCAVRPDIFRRHVSPLCGYGSAPSLCGTEGLPHVGRRVTHNAERVVLRCALCVCLPVLTVTHSLLRPLEGPDRPVDRPHDMSRTSHRRCSVTCYDVRCVWGQLIIIM